MYKGHSARTCTMYLVFKNWGKHSHLSLENTNDCSASYMSLSDGTHTNRANNVDPDLTPQHVASYQDHHCLPLIQQFIEASRSSRIDFIIKTRLYKFDPLKPHFYIVKLGFTGVDIIFLILIKIIDCGYSLEPSRRGGSNECPQYMVWAEIWKLSEFLSDNYHFLMVKFS